jgi:hypothetical protein
VLPALGHSLFPHNQYNTRYFLCKDFTFQRVVALNQFLKLFLAHPQEAFAVAQPQTLLLILPIPVTIKLRIFRKPAAQIKASVRFRMFRHTIPLARVSEFFPLFETTHFFAKNFFIFKSLPKL